MKKQNAVPSIEETTRAFAGLLQQGIATFGLLGDRAVQEFRGAVQALAPGNDCCCEIPPPCWMPQPLCDVTSQICHGGTATLRLRVTNGSMKPRSLLIDATGDTTGVRVTPSNLALGPMQRAIVVVSLTIGVDQPFGEEHDLLIWVRGCREHFLRWKVTVSSRGIDACQVVEVEDAPDIIHHWYDHFYCNRSCPHGS